MLLLIKLHGLDLLMNALQLISGGCIMFFSHVKWLIVIAQAIIYYLNQNIFKLNTWSINHLAEMDLQNNETMRTIIFITVEYSNEKNRPYFIECASCGAIWLFMQFIRNAQIILQISYKQNNSKQCASNIVHINNNGCDPNSLNMFDANLCFCSKLYSLKYKIKLQFSNKICFELNFNMQIK